MRFAKAEELLKLAFAMQSSAEGIGLADIQSMFEVTRRTAMRMRDAVARVFPQIEQITVENRTKRWRIPATAINRQASFSADELAILQSAKQQFARDGLSFQAKALDNLANKIKSLQRSGMMCRLEPDLEAIIEAEGLATRAGPRPKIAMPHLHSLRDAIKACRIVELQYKGHGKSTAETKRIRPYGFLYGHRHYLVGEAADKSRAGSFYKFTLAWIEDVIVTTEGFTRDKKFNLQKYAEDSFGVWTEKPQQIVWRFTKAAASNAKDFIFHPQQKLKMMKDGSLQVSFTAGGMLEMAWHLYMWGDQVKVIKPVALRNMIKGSVKKWNGLP